MQRNHAYPRAKLSGDKHYLLVPIDANVTFKRANIVPLEITHYDGSTAFLSPK